jgi:hypothetical protein
MERDGDLFVVKGFLAVREWQVKTAGGPEGYG